MIKRLILRKHAGDAIRAKNEGAGRRNGRALYAVYSRENNESEQATKDKNAAFAALDSWIRVLYGYAKFALKDMPQHLQMFGKIVG